MKYFVNSPAKKKAKKKAGKKKRTAKQKANDSRLGRLAKARAKSKKSTTKRASSKGTTMAAKKKGKGGSKPRRRSAAKKRSFGVRLVRKGGVVYQGNPKRRRRSVRRYGRNPGLMAVGKQAVVDASMVLVGGAASKTISKMIPFGGSPVIDLAKGLVVAIALRKVSNKFLGGDKARFVAAGALAAPLKDAIVGYVPGAAGFLGEDDLAAYSSMAAYSDVAGYVEGTGSFTPEGADLGAYSEINY